MKFKIAPSTIDWWYWMLTLMALVAGLAGRVEGFHIVVVISAVQFVHLLLRDGFAALTTQVRLVYGSLAVLALLDPTRVLFVLMLIGTVMVTFFDRCIIAKVLMAMPWNRGSGSGPLTH